MESTLEQAFQRGTNRGVMDGKERGVVDEGTNAEGRAVRVSLSSLEASTKRSERMTHNLRKPNEESVKSRRWRRLLKAERLGQCKDLNESKGKTALV